jgi:hypothetical protein
VVAGLIQPDFEDTAELDLLFQDGIVVLLEEREELVGMTPLGLVIVLDDERLARRGRGLRKSGATSGEHQEDQRYNKDAVHELSLFE